MATRKSPWILFGIFVISVWFLGFPTQAGAETWKYKYYNYAEKRESASVGDVEGRAGLENLDKSEGGLK